MRIRSWFKRRRWGIRSAAYVSDGTTVVSARRGETSHGTMPDGRPVVARIAKNGGRASISIGEYQ